VAGQTVAESINDKGVITGIWNLLVQPLHTVGWVRFP